MKNRRAFCLVLLMPIILSGCWVFLAWDATMAGVTASSGTDGKSIVLSWTAVKDADYYEVFYAASETGVFSGPIVTKTAGLVIDLALSSYSSTFGYGRHYWFLVRAVKPGNSQLTYSALNTTAVEGYTSPTAFAETWAWYNTSSGKVQLVIDATAKTLTYTVDSWNSTTSSWYTTRGCVFTMTSIGFSDAYLFSTTANVLMVSPSQTKYYDTATSAFVAYTPSTVTSSSPDLGYLTFDYDQDLNAFILKIYSIGSANTYVYAYSSSSGYQSTSFNTSYEMVKQ